MVSLQIADALRAQQRRLLGALDTFGHRAEAELLGETEQMAEKNLALRPARQISNKRAIDLDNVDR